MVDGHIAIYDGNGLLIEALNENEGIVHYRRADSDAIVAIRRFTTDGIVKQGAITTNTNTNTNTKNQNASTKFVAKVATFSEYEESLTCDPDDPDVNEFHTHTYTMQAQEIDYQSMINQYKMPFNYIWAMLVIGKEKAFAFDLADLAYKSKIEITVHDNEKKNTDIITDVYTKKTEIKTTGDVLVSYQDKDKKTGTESKRESANDTRSTTYTKVHTITTITNTLDTAVTLADTWNVTYTKEYKYSNSTSDSGKSTTNLEDVLGGWTTDSRGASNLNGQIKGNAESEVASEGKQVSGSQVSSSYTQYKHSTINASTTSQNIVESKKYTTTLSDVSSGGSDTSDSKPVHDSTGGTYRENNNFVNLLKEHYDTRSNIVNASDWLFNILSKNNDTSDMVDLTKYFLYKVTGNDYGVTEFDVGIFDMIKANKSKTMGLTSTSLTREEFIQKVQSYSAALSRSGTQTFMSNAGVIYDVCVKNNVNPVLCAAQAWMEQCWVAPGTSPYNYWGIAVYNGQNYGQSYSSMEQAVQVYCDNINERMKGEHGALEWSKKCSQYDKNFTGTMSTLYDVLSNWACISSNPSPAEQAPYAARYVNNIIKQAEVIFGPGALNSGGGVLASGGVGTRGTWTSKTTGQTFNLYLQASGPWANNLYGYGGSSMANAGCGPTALAIIASGYNGSITPETVRDDIINKRHGGVVSNYSSPELMQPILGDLGINVRTSVEKFTAARAISCLQNGGKVWFVVKTCKYTSGAHCLALIDYDESTGKVYVAHGSSRTFGWEDIQYLLANAEYGAATTALYIDG